MDHQVIVSLFAALTTWANPILFLPISNTEYQSLINTSPKIQNGPPSAAGISNPMIPIKHVPGSASILHVSPLMANVLDFEPEPNVNTISGKVAVQSTVYSFPGITAVA